MRKNRLLRSLEAVDGNVELRLLSGGGVSVLDAILDGFVDERDGFRKQLLSKGKILRFDSESDLLDRGSHRGSLRDIGDSVSLVGENTLLL